VISPDSGVAQPGGDVAERGDLVDRAGVDRGPGHAVDHLETMRLFFLASRPAAISETASRKSTGSKNAGTFFQELELAALAQLLPLLFLTCGFLRSFAEANA
jgi:hypothetical protein